MPAKIILASADGCGTAEIMRRSGKAKPVVWRWQARFMAEGVAGLTRDKMRKPGRPPLPVATCGGWSIWLVHGTSNTRTPKSFGFGASHGDALKRVSAANAPCCHSLCIEERLKS